MHPRRPLRELLNDEERVEDSRPRIISEDRNGRARASTLAGTNHVDAGGDAPTRLAVLAPMGVEMTKLEVVWPWTSSWSSTVRGP